MKKFIAALGLATVVAAVFVATAMPAILSNGKGQSCPAGSVGVYHFVNNQTGGAAGGTLTASFTDGSVWTVGASKVNQNTQHFIVESEGALITASTGGLPGRLVLSDFSCGGVKK